MSTVTSSGGAALAEAPPRDDSERGASDAVRTQYLSFFVAGEEYAVGILRVREIIEHDVVTRVPSMPPSVRGVLNLRGRVVPIVDLALTFGLPESVVTRRTCIVVVEREVDGEAALLGVLVDAVSQVLDLPPEDIEPPPAFGTRARAEILDGLGRSGRKFVMLLNLDRAVALDASLSRELLADAADDAAAAAAPTEANAAAAGDASRR